MKNTLFIFLCFVLGFQSIAQTTLDRQLKYWYLRDRLKYFIVQSDGDSPKRLETQRLAVLAMTGLDCVDGEILDSRPKVPTRADVGKSHFVFDHQMLCAE